MLRFKTEWLECFADARNYALSCGTRVFDTTIYKSYVRGYNHCLPLDDGCRDCIMCTSPWEKQRGSSEVAMVKFGTGSNSYTWKDRCQRYIMLFSEGINSIKVIIFVFGVLICNLLRRRQLRNEVSSKSKPVVNVTPLSLITEFVLLSAVCMPPRRAVPSSTQSVTFT